MKGSVITSTVLHVFLLVWLLVSFGSAKPLEVTAGEALPVELVTDVSQLQEGAKEAPKKDEAAKEITKNDTKIDNAINNGDNNFDLKSVPTPVEKPSNVQKTAAAEKSDVVAPQDTEAQDSKDDVKEDTAVEPDTEVAALEKPAVDVKPEPRPEEKPVEDKPVVETKDEPLPDAVPIPTTRPKEEPKKVEEKKEEPKKDEPKKVEDKKDEKKDAKVADSKTDKKAKKAAENKKARKSTTSKDSDFNAKEVAELLNKVENDAGGAKRNAKAKAQGAEKTNSAGKLSASEMDALKGMIEKNWSIMQGTETNGVVITVRMELNESGEIVGEPEVKGSGGDGSALSVLESGAVRAVKRSAPFDQLPKDKYDTWKVVTVNFTPSDIM
jgi:TolA protein